jgi:hypothetical protein
MVRIETPDAAIEINPGDPVKVTVNDERARERDRAAFRELGRVSGSKVTIQTEPERVAARKNTTEPRSPAETIRELTAALDGEPPPLSASAQR